jgi:perosamine synthetase
MRDQGKEPMWNLLPTELHQYSLKDLARGLKAIGRTDRAPDPHWPFPLGESIPIRSGRAAIVLSIQALGLRPGSSVGVPLYCCPVVFKAIKTAGCRPRFLDVDPGTFCISPEDLSAKRSECDAVVAVHMFGHLCEMGGLQPSMAGKPIIEDCAQAVGSKLDGQPAGTMGTIGVFSFRLGKYLSAGEGASIYTGHADLRSRISGLVAGLSEPNGREEIIHLLETYARAKLRTKPLWGLLGSSVWGRYNKHTDFMDKSPIVMSKIFRSDLQTTRHRMVRLDHMIDSQRAHAEYYMAHLTLDASMFCSERPGTSYNRLMFPIIFASTQDRDFVRSRLKSRGISSATPYEEAIEGAARNYGYKGDCPVSEKLLRTTLVIPCHHRLRPNDVESITRSVNEAWGELHPG